jgi:cystathionine beta-synthase
MVLDAEKEGRLTPGSIIVEPTSGNTGMGLSMAAASRGYKCIITMPEKMSQEKRSVQRALGSEIIRTPNEMQFDNTESHVGIAVALQEKLENCHMLDQYKNPANPISHYDGTGQEIWDQCEGRLDYVIVSAGTGGTICGIARRLKELDPNIQIIGVDPVGSILAEPAELNKEVTGYQVEGIGYDFIPRVLDRQHVDKWIKSEDGPSFEYARKLIAREGMLVGGSSGTAMYAAMQIARDLPEGKRVVVLLPDNIRNYITKFVNDDWMYENGFISEEECTKRNSTELFECKDWGQDYTIADLHLHEAKFLQDNILVSEAIDLMQQHGFDQFPVKNAAGQIVGVLDARFLTEKLIKNKLKASDTITLSIHKNYRKVSSSIKLNELARIFERQNFVLVDGLHVASWADLLAFIKTKQS